MDINEQMNRIVTKSQLIKDLDETPDDVKIMAFWFQEDKGEMMVFMKTVGNPLLTNCLRICHTYDATFLDELIEHVEEEAE